MKAHRGPSLLLLGLAALVYLPALSGGFAYDDFHNVVENAALAIGEPSIGALVDAAFSSDAGPLKRPLAMLSFAWNRSLFGPGPYSFKLTNLAIHLLNSLLVFALVSRVLRNLSPLAMPVTTSDRVALLVALLWAVHPIHTTAVAYVVQRMTSLSSLFTLAAVLAYVAARERSLARGWRAAWPLLAVAAGMTTLSLFTKEIGVLVPFYLLVVEASIFRFRGAPRLRRAIGALAIGIVLLGAAVAIIAPEFYTSPYERRPFTLAQRLLTESRVLFFYLRLVLLPTPAGFSLFHDDFPLSTDLVSPPSTLMALLAWCAILGITVRKWRQWPLPAFAVGWFLAGQLLESTIVPLDLVYEHRNYLPALGIIAGAVVAGRALLQKCGLGHAAPLLGAAITIILGAMTTVRAWHWSDPITLALITERYNPASQSAVYELGRVRYELYRATRDQAFRQKALADLARAIPLGDEAYLPLTALVIAYEADGQRAPAGWVERLGGDLKTANPTLPRLNSVVLIMDCQMARKCGVEPNAIQTLIAAALANPRLSVNNRAKLLDRLAVYYINVLGDLPAGVSILEELVTSDPDNPEFRLRLAEAYLVQNREGPARAQLNAIPAADSFWQRLDRLSVERRKQRLLARLDAATNE